jgi:hypothetical protein
MAGELAEVCGVFKAEEHETPVVSRLVHLFQVIPNELDAGGIKLGSVSDVELHLVFDGEDLPTGNERCDDGVKAVREFPSRPSSRGAHRQEPRCFDRLIVLIPGGGESDLDNRVLFL